MKKLVKICALAMAALMLMGVCACTATDNNPGIGRVGKVRFKLSDYMSFYQQYQSYASYITDLNGVIKNQLINYGVTLNHCYEEGITLDETEEAELKAKVDETIDSAIKSMTADSSLTDETEIYNAKLNVFLEQLKAAGYKSLDAYRKVVEDDNRKSMLITKLQDKVKAEVEFGNDQIQEYFDKNKDTDKEKYEDDPSAFSDAYNKFISDQGVMPLYIPADMFTVKHCLIQYENQDKVSDTVPGEFNDELNKKIQDIRDALEDGITLEDFIKDYVENKDYNNDTVLIPKEAEEGEDAEPVTQSGYIVHGYIMNEKLINKYYDGFGAAACMLYYGEDWTVPAEEKDADATEAPEATPAPDDSDDTEEQSLVDKYSMKFYETTDGHKIAEVKTSVAGGGIHFIYVNEELPEGAVELDLTDTESDVYKTIAKFYRQELETNHFNEVFEGWKANTKIALNDSYIDNYAKNYLGLR